MTNPTTPNSQCQERNPSRARRIAVASWAVGFVALTLFEPVVRLGVRGLRTIEAGLSPTEWVALAIVVPTLWWAEGYRALQRRFVPHLVARAFEAAERLRGIAVLGAPLSALSLAWADRRAMARAWAGVAAITIAVLVVRRLPEHARGIVDLGVAVALGWGLAALVVQFVKAVREPLAASVVPDAPPSEPVVVAERRSLSVPPGR